MIREKRLQELENYIHYVGVVSLDELCLHFNMSKNTIRRDINTLLEQNTIQKIYGGVTSLKHSLVPYESRDFINKQSKALIAQKAAEYIKPKELIYIDSGTTAHCISSYLPKDLDATILTNNLDIIETITEFNNVTLLIVGNTFNVKTRSFIGNDTLFLLEKYNITKAFMSAAAVSLNNGLSNSNQYECEIKKAIIKKAQKVFLLVDSSKFERVAPITYASLEDVDYIITNNPLPIKYQEFCSKNKIQIIVTS